jgi:hypothetical protein
MSSHKSKTIIKNCKHHGRTEFYYYPDSDRTQCKECTRERRRARYASKPKRTNDATYTKDWKKTNPDRVRMYRYKYRIKKYLQELNRRSDVVEFVSLNIDTLENLFRIYGVDFNVEEISKWNLHSWTIKSVQKRVEELAFERILSHTFDQIIAQQTRVNNVNQIAKTQAESILNQLHSQFELCH